MKKILVIAMALSALSLVLVGCGSGEPAAGDSAAGTSSATSEAATS